MVVSQSGVRRPARRCDGRIVARLLQLLRCHFRINDPVRGVDHEQILIQEAAIPPATRRRRARTPRFYGPGVRDVQPLRRPDGEIRGAPDSKGSRKDEAPRRLALPAQLPDQRGVGKAGLRPAPARLPQADGGARRKADEAVGAADVVALRLEARLQA